MVKKAKKTVEAEVYEVERFDVNFIGNDPNGGQYVDEYPFANAANAGWTVKKWRETRWAAAYPDFGVEVLDGDGAPVHGKTLLRNVRDTYFDEYEYETDEDEQGGGNAGKPAFPTGVTIDKTSGPMPTGQGGTPGNGKTPRRLGLRLTPTNS